MYFLYILKSANHKKTYIGITANLEKRVEEHNSGQVKSTKFYRPYKLVHIESFNTKTEVRKRELELKNNSFKKSALFKLLGLL